MKFKHSLMGLRNEASELNDRISKSRCKRVIEIYKRELMEIEKEGIYLEHREVLNPEEKEIKQLVKTIDKHVFYSGACVSCGETWLKLKSFLRECWQ